MERTVYYYCGRPRIAEKIASCSKSYGYVNFENKEKAVVKKSIKSHNHD